jgi:hypothetical protein
VGDFHGALLVGAFIVGVVGFFRDNVLGLTPPVLDNVSSRAARRERAVRIAGISERLRLMQLYGILVQYVVDFDPVAYPPVHGNQASVRLCDPTE